ncbi:MAG: hypothetical protein KGD63_05790 [Candidatus Lokiarchaeota archaeon]|nr:hypothetical protein [Candidatus Lokiarchaeota archaeon]
MEKKHSEVSNQNEDNIIKKLKKAIKDNTELLNPKMQDTDNVFVSESNIRDNQEINLFFDNIGNIPILDINVGNLLNIDKSNLLVSIINHMDDVSLETIYFYISIFKMITGDLPANISLILSIVENHSNKSLFISRYNQNPDIINNFYGLAIISETIKMNMNIIDLTRLKELLLDELKVINHNKILSNYYLFNCINLLKKFNFNIEMNNDILLRKINETQINDTEKEEFISNLFIILSISKLIDKNYSAKNIDNKSLKKFEDIIKNLYKNDFSLTQYSKILLIIDLLGFQQKYSKEIKIWLNKLINHTKFFMSEIENEEFSWKNDITAFSIEVKMLYWILITCLQYQSFF